MKNVLAVPAYCRILVHANANSPCGLLVIGLDKSIICTIDMGTVDKRKVKFTIISMIVSDLTWRLSLEFFLLASVYRIKALNMMITIAGNIEKLSRSKYGQISENTADPWKHILGS